MKKKKLKLPRNLDAVSAFHRTSAGSMGGSKHQAEKAACRKWEDEDGEETIDMLQKKVFKVYKRITLVAVTNVAAYNAEEAINLAESGEIVYEWEDVPENYNEEIIAAEEIEDKIVDIGD